MTVIKLIRCPTRQQQRGTVTNLLLRGRWLIVVSVPTEVPQIIASEDRNDDGHDNHDHHQSAATLVCVVWHRILRFPYDDLNGSGGPLFPDTKTARSRR